MDIPALADRAFSGVKTFPLRADAVVVSFTVAERHRPSGSEALWEVACAAPGHAKEFVRIKGANFGDAAIGPDGKSLYYTGTDGVFAIDLTTKKSRRLTTAPLLSHCGTDNKPRALDVVRELKDGGNALLFERGGPCGFEGDWQASAFYLEGLAGKRTPIVRRPNPIAGLAVDAAGTLWLSGGSCQDGATNGVVWTSSDRGDHWSKVSIEMFTPEPVKKLLTDGKLAGHVAAWGDGCPTSAHVDPGWLYLTSDGGKSWRAILPPPGIPAHGKEPDSEQDPIAAVESIGGTLDHLRLWSSTGQKKGGRLIAIAWESTDGGSTWKTLPPAIRPEPAAPPPIKIGDATFRIVLDGVIREQAGSQPRRVFPPPGP